jgi:putative permease
MHGHFPDGAAGKMRSVMSLIPPAGEADPTPSPAARAPVVVSQGLTYRDLQRAILMAWGLFIVWHLAGPLTTLLLFFLLVFILAAVLNPIVLRLQRRGVPRIASAIGLAVIALAFLGTLTWLALGPLINEVGHLSENLSDLQGRLSGYYTGLRQQYPALGQQLPPPEEILRGVTPRFTDLAGHLGRTTLNIAVGLLSVLLLLVLVIYTVAHPGPLVTGLLGAVPDRHRPRVETALRRILEQLKNWATGSLILGVIVGLMTCVGLWAIGKLTGESFPYILLFSVIAGVGELLPNIGPIVSAVPPVVVALGHSPILALWVLLLFVLIQQLENNLIVPMVMGKSLDLHPISVTFAVLVMGALFGLLGAVLAVPVCAIVKVCWEEFYLNPRHTDTDALQAVADNIITSDSPNPRDETPMERAVDRAIGDQDAGAPESTQ